MLNNNWTSADVGLMLGKVTFISEFLWYLITAGVTSILSGIWLSSLSWSIATVGGNYICICVASNINGLVWSDGFLLAGSILDYN